ncbi:SDR family oxidoreductase [Asanoa sp. WMMD1127]|uniref:SDR family NAD(P)-dependent oxidoreductase n=1 Tax=Asanoa sp. WMMD1127 TaxID=3016107 RepID=UPI0024162E0D|nr:SDR family oxidoreductase [Asanoa sp. WMMD1127]MDG4824890.1 SDR family oxidoreductase [Asanoa sp. WMMD1127]
MDLGLKGRTVIVTGATGGIGRHIARGFAAEGADVVVTYLHARDEADRLVRDLDGRGLAVRYALGEPGAATALVEAATARTGRVDVLVNNAVVWGMGAPDDERPFEEEPGDAWRTVLRANIEGALDLTRAVAPVMRRHRWGRIVHVSSVAAVNGMAGGEYYVAAKSALHGFSRSSAYSLGRAGDILSNVAMPGLTRTDRNGAIVDAAGAQIAAHTPLGRLLDAAEVANAVVYLGSAANTGITGQAIAVSGGA